MPRVQVPTGSAEYAAEARSLLQQLLSGGLPLRATVVSREKAGPKDKHPRWANGHLSVALTDPASQVRTVLVHLDKRWGDFCPSLLGRRLPGRQVLRRPGVDQVPTCAGV